MASAMIQSIRTISGNQPLMRRLNEKSGQTFKAGVPVTVDATGNVIEWNGTTYTAGAGGVAGISREAGHSLTTSGVAQTLTTGEEVIGQAAAVIIPRGAPGNDGRVAVEPANDDTVFYAQVGPAQTPVQADITAQFGMTKDADNHWYVDRTKATPATNTNVIVVKLDPIDTARGVHIMFNKLYVQQVA